MHRKLVKIVKDEGSAKQRSGYTIMEVLIASLLLVTAIAPILKGLTSAHTTAVSIERKTISLTLAQKHLEQIRAKSIYNYDEDFNNASFNLADAYYGSVTDSAVNSDLRSISVSVGYDSNGDGALDAEEMEVVLDTLLARRWGS